MSRILDGLNPQQKEAVEYRGGPLLVLAGAGSGKTRVITHRVAHIIEKKDAYPDEIMAVTFTNKAAREVRERLNHLLEGTSLKWVGTFHSLCSRILRRDVDKLGRKSDFTILDRKDQISILRDCYRDFSLDDKELPLEEVLKRIGLAKSQLKSVEDMAVSAIKGRQRKIVDFYEAYERKLQEINALDFDDLISKTVLLFQKNPEVIKYYSGKFKHLLIDEYQDVNISQYQLAKLLSDTHKNICAVGDDDQSIYGFRGADVTIILNFQRDFPGTKIIKLEQNYRSSGIIIDASNQVIKHNKERSKKTLKPNKPQGEKVGMNSYLDAREEAKHVADEITYRVNNGYNYSDFAILYRTNSLSRVIEEMLRQAGIPYEVVGGLKFYERQEIKDALAYLRFIENPRDIISFRRIINVPVRGIGSVTRDKIASSSLEQETDILKIMKDADSLPRVGKKIQDVLSQFADTIKTLSLEKDRIALPQFIQRVLDKTGYMKMLEESTEPETQDRLDNLEEFINEAFEFSRTAEDRSLSAFLEKVSLSSDVDASEDKALGWLVKEEDIKNWDKFLIHIKEMGNPAISRIFEMLHPQAQEVVKEWTPDKKLNQEKKSLLIDAFNRALMRKDFYNPIAFQNVRQNEEIKRLMTLGGDKLPSLQVYRMNRLFLEEIFKEDIAKNSGRATLLTAHMAKGLEFPVVFMIGLEENLFPHFKAIQEKKDFLIQEERRLFYVGMTRAMEKLFLSYARERTILGKSHPQSPSRFLREVPEELLDKYVPEVSRRSFTRKASPILDKTVQPVREKIAPFTTGDTVYHKIFGEGKVLHIDGTFVTVEFSGVGKKVLSENFLSPAPSKNSTQDNSYTVKPGDKVMYNIMKGVVKKTEGNHVYIILSGGKVEKVEASLVKPLKD